MQATILPIRATGTAPVFRSSQHSKTKENYKPKSYDIPAIEKAKQIIDTNVTDHWSLCLLASKAGINEYKLKAGFRHLYKISPYQYLIKLRLEKSKALLENTDLSIQEVADRVGFDNYRGYNKAFRKRYGMLPTEYRVQAEGLYGKTINAPGANQP